MDKLELFKKLSPEDKLEIIDYFLESKTELLTLMFFKCVKICENTNADTLKMQSELHKINKVWILEFNLKNI